MAGRPDGPHRDHQADRRTEGLPRSGGSGACVLRETSAAPCPVAFVDLDQVLAVLRATARDLTDQIPILAATKRRTATELFGSPRLPRVRRRNSRDEGAC